jgi:molybdopterin/thiamine biosynthesis adenylyltransferase
VLAKYPRSRYEQHAEVPEIGPAGQDKLFNSSVLIVGLGGLGCPAAQYLAAAGLGRIGLVDQDTVSLSNLQRQILYGEKDIDKLKADAAFARLQDISSFCEFQKYPFFLTAENAVETIEGYDIILDCTDNFDSRYLLNYISFVQKKPLVSASIYHHDGQISVFKAFKGEAHPCYQCLYPRTDKLKNLPNCKEGGIVGPVAGILGTMQAVVTINELLNIGETLSGWLVLFNSLSFEMQKIRITKRPDCEICSINQSLEEIGKIPITAKCGLK